MKFKTVKENNEQLNSRGIVGYEGEFVINFRDSKRIFFSIQYGMHGHLNQNPYFSTSAGKLNRNRNDYESCGQAQSILTNQNLKEFFEKWNNYHLKTLTFENYNELMQDIKNLKDTIPYIDSDNFDDIVSFDRKVS